ncbi:MAG: hypothetical protein DSY90_02055 [Deltaproteobacteria bacterium]|nr:MAG: hypothetical protein DSY90_02055 [Deltaproteobacteria bacterium]RTZ99346.1 MAG: hypothetical protein DSY89_08555 [Deltaproteobacteria bacterium]
MTTAPSLLDTRVKTESGSFDIEARIGWIGNDLLVSIYGGEKPHIGAVAAAHPRPSLKNPAVISATASVICYTAHKEDDLAKRAAEILSAILNTRVVVTAGIHWDRLTEEGIEQIVKNSRHLVTLISEKAKSTRAAS